MKLFWSWQSDTHQPSARYFVRDILADLAKDLNDIDGSEAAARPDQDPDSTGQENQLGADDQDEIQIDHDTSGVGGSPPIAETILRKIREAAVFIADVTPVGKTPGGKFLPNPNVMIDVQRQ